MQETTNYGLKKPGVDDYYNVGDFNDNMDTIDAKMKELEDASGQSQELADHIADKTNPHQVTKAQVGLSNVPNVSTNNQTPTYVVPQTVSNLQSGETLAAAMGKISKAVSNLNGFRFGINGDGKYGYYKADDSFIPFNSSGVPKYLWAYNGNYLQYPNYLYTQSQNLNITEDGVLFFAVSNSYAFSNEKQSAHVVYATINGLNQPLGCVCDSNQQSMNPMTYYMNVKAGDVVSVTDYMSSANGHSGNICYTIHAMLVPMGELEIIDNGTFSQDGGGFTASGIDDSVCSFANHKLTMKKKGTIAFVFNIPNSFYYETYKNDVQYTRIGTTNVVNSKYRTAIPVDVGDTVYITTAPSGYIYFYK